MSDQAKEIAKLPTREARLEALSKTGLVRKWEEGDKHDGLLIWNGEISSSSPGGSKTLFPKELLNEDQDDDNLAEEAKEVLLGQNRILIGGDQAKGLEWLEDQDEAVRSIKQLDILFDQDIIHEWSEKKSDWQLLAEFIAKDLILQDLELSLDSGPTYQTYMEWDSKESSLQEVKPVYKEIIEILRKSLQGQAPKSFHVHWVVFSDTETEAEKEIMGQEYDSSKEGKIPANRRSPHYPHGAPKKELEFPEGVRL